MFPLSNWKIGNGTSFQSFIFLKEISDEDVIKLKNLANWLPVVVINSPLKFMRPIILNYQRNVSNIVKEELDLVNFIPLLVFTCKYKGYVWPSEIFLPSVDTCLGVQNIMLGATTLGCLQQYFMGTKG